MYIKLKNQLLLSLILVSTGNLYHIKTQNFLIIPSLNIELPNYITNDFEYLFSCIKLRIKDKLIKQKNTIPLAVNKSNRAIPINIYKVKFSAL